MAKRTKNKPPSGGFSDIASLPIAAMEGYSLNDLFTQLARSDASPRGDTPDRAQEKAFEAMEARTPARRIALARKALAISPLCTDAYGILAREANTPGEAIALFRQAVDAGEQALGAATFSEDVGQF